MLLVAGLVLLIIGAEALVRGASRMAASIGISPLVIGLTVVARWEGWLFLAYYALYVLYLILVATQHDALPLFSSVMLLFVVPLTVITLAVLVVREMRWRRDRAGAAKS